VRSRAAARCWVGSRLAERAIGTPGLRGTRRGVGEPSSKRTPGAQGCHFCSVLAVHTVYGCALNICVLCRAWLYMRRAQLQGRTAAACLLSCRTVQHLRQQPVLEDVSECCACAGAEQYLEHNDNDTKCRASRLPSASASQSGHQFYTNIQL